ncbi:MAG: stage V sporulation protein AA [Eubacteriales bacterium]|nr:stage V sporulation protein AA [Eubacteriales bacterium]
MAEIIYLKMDKLVRTSKKDVYLKDISQIACNKDFIGKIRAIKVASFNNDEKRGRLVFDIMDAYNSINEIVPNAQIESIGESDCVIEYKKEGRPHPVLNVILIAVVCIITFLGSAYGIMAYNNDVGTPEIFSQAYQLFGEDNMEKYKVLEISYSIGLLAGIVVFYDHFMGKRITKAPTPLEVAMNLYENDECDALIDSSGCEKK